MHQETHEPRCNNGVANEQVPSRPLLLDPVELAKVGIGIQLLRGWMQRSRCRRIERHCCQMIEDNKHRTVTVLRKEFDWDHFSSNDAFIDRDVPKLCNFAYQRVCQSGPGHIRLYDTYAVCRCI